MNEDPSGSIKREHSIMMALHWEYIYQGTIKVSIYPV
jgi:hypothetical protein